VVPRFPVVKRWMRGRGGGGCIFSGTNDDALNVSLLWLEELDNYSFGIRRRPGSGGLRVTRMPLDISTYCNWVGDVGIWLVVLL
jgi:hypothetical protein